MSTGAEVNSEKCRSIGVNVAQGRAAAAGDIDLERATFLTVYRGYDSLHLFCYMPAYLISARDLKHCELFYIIYQKGHTGIR